jgi:hypothetical protein
MCLAVSSSNPYCSSGVLGGSAGAPSAPGDDEAVSAAAAEAMMPPDQEALGRTLVVTKVARLE